MNNKKIIIALFFLKLLNGIINLSPDIYPPTPVSSLLCLSSSLCLSARRSRVLSARANRAPHHPSSPHHLTPTPPPPPNCRARHELQGSPLFARGAHDGTDHERAAGCDFQRHTAAADPPDPASSVGRPSPRQVTGMIAVLTPAEGSDERHRGASLVTADYSGGS